MMASNFVKERGRKDLMKLLQEGLITKTVKKIRMIDEEIIRRTVEFILQSDLV